MQNQWQLTPAVAQTFLESTKPRGLYKSKVEVKDDFAWEEIEAWSKANQDSYLQQKRQEFNQDYYSKFNQVRKEAIEAEREAVKTLLRQRQKKREEEAEAKKALLPEILAAIEREEAKKKSS